MLCAVLYRMGEETPFANVFVENGKALAPNVAPDLLLRRVAASDGIGFVTPDDGEGYVRALPWAITDPQVWAEVFDPADPVVETEGTEEAEIDPEFAEDDAEEEEETDADDTEEEETEEEETEEDGDELDEDDDAEAFSETATVIETPTGRIEIYHSPGGKPHNQKNHTRHGYIRKNPKLGNNVDAKIIKKSTVSAGLSNFAKKKQRGALAGAANAQKTLDSANADPNSPAYTKQIAQQTIDYYKDLANKSINQGKAKLNGTYYTDHGKGKMVAVGASGKWGVIEITETSYAPLGGKATTRVGKKVIVDFEKVGIGGVAPTKSGKSIGSEREKKAIKAAKDAANPLAQEKKAAKAAAAAAKAGDTSGTTNSKNAQKYVQITGKAKAEWDAHWNDTYNKQTNFERSAISSYTGNGYKGINGGQYGSDDSYGGVTKWNGLRNPPPTANDREKIKQLDSAMQKAAVPRNVTVFRGTSYEGFKTLKEGQEFSDAGFLSTSIKKSSAFSGNQSFEIRVPKGAKGLYVEKLGIKTEYELLLDRSSKFRVVSRTDNYQGGRTHFVLELLGSHNA